MNQLKTAKIGYILISVSCYLTGLCCIFHPAYMESNGRMIAAILLVAYGMIKIIGYFAKDLYCLAFQYDFACGIFLIALGLIDLCVGNHHSVDLLAALGILILLDSLLAVQTALDARRFGLSEWKWILFFAVCSGVCGVLVLVRDTILLAGWALLAEGVMRHYIVCCTVRTEPRISERN